MRIVTTKKPSLNQLSSLKFAFNICKFVKSNAEDLPKEDVDGNSDAYFALVSLGFKSSNVKNIIRKIEKDNIGIDTEDLIKFSLKELR